MDDSNLNGHPNNWQSGTASKKRGVKKISVVSIHEDPEAFEPSQRDKDHMYGEMYDSSRPNSGDKINDIGMNEDMDDLRKPKDDRQS